MTQAATEERSKLRKHFGRFDMLFFLICTLVGVDTLGAVASSGAEGFTWLVVLAVFFFIPYALLTAELGAAFPEEGGAYVWTKLAWGRFVAAVNSVLYWLSNPVWMGGLLCITAVETFNTFLGDLGTAGQYLFSLAFIWFGVWAAILSFGIGKWIPTLGAWARIALLAFFSLSVVFYAFDNGLHPPALSEFSPSYALFIGLVPLLFFNFVGFELPSAAGEEMKDPQKDVPFTVLRAALAAVVLYGVPILAILMVLPTEQITGLGGFIDAMKTVLVLTTFWAALASLVGLFPGLGDGGLLNDDALPEGFSRGTFQLVVFVPLLITLAIGVIFYILGRRTREQTVKAAPPAEAMPEVTRV